MLRRSTLAVLILVLLVVSGAVNGLTRFYTDWLWFRDLGYDSVLWTVLGTAWGVRLVVGLAYFAFLLFNLLLTRPVVGRALSRFEGTPLPEIFTARRVTQFFAAVSALVAVFAALAASLYWEVVQKFLYGGAFGVTDPLFGRDVGFYVFRLPFYLYLYHTGMGLLILTLVAVGVIYVLSGQLTFSGFSPSFQGQARYHLALLLAGVFGLKAWGYWLSQANLLYSTRGAVFGAGYTDVHVNLLGYQILTVVAAACALIVLVSMVARSGRWLLAGVFLLAAVSLLLGSAYPGMVQRFVVEPNELAKEAPYIRHNIKYTRLGWGLDRVEERPFDVRDDLTYAELQQEQDTLQNIRLWDWRPVQATYGQLQEMRPYYDFVGVDVDRYPVEGQVRAVTLAARELNPEKIPAQARTWLNLHLKYTHGYGLVMSPVNRVTEEGMPDLWVRNIPPESVRGPKVERPQIYFGELTRDYVITNTRSPEFDYPLGDRNAYTTYEADTGVRLTPLARLAFAARFGTVNLLLAGDITGRSRIHFYRNIRERVQRIAPFLRYDRDPYLVVAGGRLYWLQDAYVTSDLFPYSEPVGEWGNYVRNSVKVVIDAYSGRTTFYLWDEREPLAAAYARIFPRLFRPRSAMPAELVRHVRYPEDLFRLQAQVYAVYHMSDTNVFYNKEDVWAIPREIVAGEQVEVEPYYVQMRLPQAVRSEFLLMQPFTPARKNNMVAWLSVQCDPENYGRLVVFKFPKQSLTFGPSQVEARIDQDSDISRQLTLWNQKGSRVIRGNLLVIPVRRSILYVEPIYLQAEQSQMPELKRVVVSFRDRVVMEQTIEAALARIFGVAPPAPVAGPVAPAVPGKPVPAAAAGELIRQAAESLREAERRLGAGDWTGFGTAMGRLRRALEELERGR
ncbi:MAG TPA: UPF0182 family protein [Firmicutes bacterium]|nr:UPF0182 family protein [Bacillota bacterium]